MNRSNAEEVLIHQVKPNEVLVIQKNRIGSAASEVAKGGPSQDLRKVWSLLKNGGVLQLSWMTTWMT